MRPHWYATLSTLFFCTLLVVCPAYAVGKSIEASHTYFMGDADSRQHAVRMCYSEAKRKAAEQAGMYIESASRTRNMTLEHDEVHTFTATLLTAEELEDTITLTDGHLSVTCRTRVFVDMEKLNADLERIANDPKLRKEILPSQSLHSPKDIFPSQIQPSTQRLSPTQLRALEDPEHLLRKQKELQQNMATRSKAVRKIVQKGMNIADVKETLGLPQHTFSKERSGYTYTCTRYGNITIVFRDNAALCMRKHLESRKGIGSCHCAGSIDSFIWR